ncbi:hypothetical protein RvY_15858 [Ramazzottius varieornatus]|uniref:Uncharacterized protein n=1 Tax=Ramazzottius varieornatus TaxID=947166 RepID=A0A1D1VWE0_RAMVA|nr:hypothetical protein RvY_15858 [Ramazzottius varieornatus]
MVSVRDADVSVSLEVYAVVVIGNKVANLACGTGYQLASWYPGSVEGIWAANSFVGTPRTALRAPLLSASKAAGPD